MIFVLILLVVLAVKAAFWIAVWVWLFGDDITVTVSNQPPSTPEPPFDDYHNHP